MGVDADRGRPPAGQAHPDLHASSTRSWARPARSGRPYRRCDRRRTGGGPRPRAAAGAAAGGRPSTPTRTSTPAAATDAPSCRRRRWTGPRPSGSTRAVTVADDLAAARWVVDAAHWDDRVPPPSRCTRRARPPSPTTTSPRSSGSPRDPRVVAVGETGLDYYWDYSPPDAQQRGFRWHIDLAKRLGKPLMIHDRDAHADVLRVLREEGPPETVVFHCFSGDAAMARECVDAGYVLSFAGPVTFKNARGAARGGRARARGPAPRRDRRARSSPRTRTAAGPTSRTACRGRCAALAAVRGVSDERLARRARRNAERVFRLGELPSGRAGWSRSGAPGSLVRRSAAARSALAVCHSASVALTAPLRFRDR